MRISLERRFKLGLGAFALVVGAIALAKPFGNPQKSDADAAQVAASSRIIANLAKVEPASRNKIDYAKLDLRLNRMVEKPTMVTVRP